MSWLEELFSAVGIMVSEFFWPTFGRAQPRSTWQHVADFVLLFIVIVLILGFAYLITR